MGRGGFLTIVIALASLAAQGRVIDRAMHHLRHGAEREWDEFAAKAEAAGLAVAFDAKANAAEHTLGLRHRDLRHVWRVMLNEKELAKLPQEDNETISLIPLPAGALRDGANEVR